jgi:hypothetical protein
MATDNLRKGREVLISKLSWCPKRKLDKTQISTDDRFPRTVEAMTETSWGPAFVEGDFRVGRVLSRSFAILLRNLPQFVGLSAIAVLPNLILPMLEARRSGFLLGVAGILAFVLPFIVQAVILYGAFQVMRGQPFRVGVSLRMGLARFLPLLGTTICMTLAMGVAGLLLIVPGLIVATVLFVSVPACVVERLGPFKSMGRSVTLTKGHRWKIFGILLLFSIIGSIGVAVLVLLLSAVAGVAALVGSLIWQAVLTAYYAVITVVTYHDLRVAKEGVDIERIAAVFE